MKKWFRIYESFHLEFQPLIVSNAITDRRKRMINLISEIYSTREEKPNDAVTRLSKVLIFFFLKFRQPNIPFSWTFFWLTQNPLILFPGPTQIRLHINTFTSIVLTFDFKISSSLLFLLFWGSFPSWFLLLPSLLRVLSFSIAKQDKQYKNFFFLWMEFRLVKLAFFGSIISFWHLGLCQFKHWIFCLVFLRQPHSYSTCDSENYHHFVVLVALMYIYISWICDWMLVVGSWMAKIIVFLVNNEGKSKFWGNCSF